jgi:hypothetical protein
MWCLRYPVRSGHVRESWYDNAVDAFEAYGEIEAAVRFGRPAWAQLWSPRGNLEAECDAPGLGRAEAMVEAAFG